MEMGDYVRRMAGAFTVLFGPRGAVAQEARDQGRSQQALGREAAAAVSAAEPLCFSRKIAHLAAGGGFMARVVAAAAPIGPHSLPSIMPSRLL
jgi:hypothetical protein